MHMLNDRQKDLLQALESAPIGDAASQLTFERRLARDNAWSESFAQLVVREYRRYLFLAKEAGHPVTPSDEVDQAWHLHMVYTRSYWQDFCGPRGLLAIDLHHGPTKGGRAEGTKFDDWYARTLASYERLFGEKPPQSIWPAAEVRFGRAPHFQRVNTRENWVINKRTARRTAAAALTTGVIAGSGLGCAVLATNPVPYADGQEDPVKVFLTIAVVAGAVFLVAGVFWMIGRLLKRASGSRRCRTHDGSTGCGGGGWFWWGGSGCGSSNDSNDGHSGCGGASGCGSSGGDGGGSSGCGGGGCGGGGD